MLADVLRERFRGCLLGLAIGDALGARYEGYPPERVLQRCSTLRRLMDSPHEEIWYTDDTQMTIGVCETLISHGEVIQAELCRAFVANYVPARGYGRGARAVLDAMEEGEDYQRVAEEHFPGGSYGNGAAMRVAPIGLLFGDAPEKLWKQARLSALPTHRHLLGIEGAQILALAIAIASRSEAFDRERFYRELLAVCTTPEYRQHLELAAKIETPAGLGTLGNRIEALYSVPTAIASFALTPDSSEETIGNVIFLGGDTDTLAAMAGALSGAHLGAGKLPSRLVGLLESSPKGRAYIEKLASELFATLQAISTEA